MLDRVIRHAAAFGIAVALASNSAFAQYDLQQTQPQTGMGTINVPVQQVAPVQPPTITNNPQYLQPVIAPATTGATLTPQQLQ